MENACKNLGVRIRTIRQLRMMYQNELAEECGISREYLCRIETGKSLPTVQVLSSIAKALNCKFKCTLVLED